MEVADQFKGLPMENLIGGPLSAAVKANFDAAKSTADFIQTVGFDQVMDPTTKQMSPGKPRMVDFSFERPNNDETGKRVVDLVKISVPMLAIVPIPSLQVDLIDIVFDMEVKSSTTSENNSAKSGSLEASVSGGFAGFTASVKINGSISTSEKNTRSSDTSAKYHVQVKATSKPLPEGLARVLDMMNQAIRPREVKQFTPDEKGKLPMGTDGKIDESKGKPVDNNGAPPPLTPAQSN
jgi:hypothetical protein